MPAQPQDEWTYLRPEEFADDDELERIDHRFDTGAEDAALHVIELDGNEPASTAIDAGQTFVVATMPEMPTSYFDDEEPDARRDSPDQPTTDDAVDADEEPALDQILTSQHYSFDEESR
jgi:hypothetical protein